MPWVRDENERRDKRRFPLQRQLRYTILEHGKAVAAGTGVSSNMSSHGFAFTADWELPLDAAVEIAVSWPVSLDNGCPLKVMLRGRIVRTAGLSMACTIERVEFRTQSRVQDALSVFAGLGALSPQENSLAPMEPGGCRA